MTTSTSYRSNDVIEGEVLSGRTSSSGGRSGASTAAGFTSRATSGAQPGPYAATAAPWAVAAAPVYRRPRRSVLLAGLLAFFLGPLGMVYATFFGALVMGGVTILAAILTLGHAALFPFPLCAMWAMWSAWRKNAVADAIEGRRPRW